MFIPKAAIEAAHQAMYRFQHGDWCEDNEVGWSEDQLAEGLRAAAPLLAGKAWADGAMEGARWREDYDDLLEDDDFPQDQLPPYPRNPYLTGAPERPEDAFARTRYFLLSGDTRKWEEIPELLQRSIIASAPEPYQEEA